MKKVFTCAKQTCAKLRRGFSLVELLIAVVVLGILSSMLIAAGTASQNKARMAVAQNDLDSVKNAVYQALMAHPNVMKLKENPETFKTVVGYINSEVDDAWRMQLVGSPQGSGLVAQTATQKDPWGNPYGVYIYTNEKRAAYKNTPGADPTSSTNLGKNDSCMYIVIVSAGRNATGGPLGVDGVNYDANTGTFVATSAAVNNSDGVDDLGTIIRIKNGTLLTATFGTEQCTLGTMQGYQWIYGNPGSGGGILQDYAADNPATGAAEASSIDFYVDKAAVEKYAQGTGKLKTVGSFGTPPTIT